MGDWIPCGLPIKAYLIELSIWVLSIEPKYLIGLSQDLSKLSGFLVGS